MKPARPSSRISRCIVVTTVALILYSFQATSLMAQTAEFTQNAKSNNSVAIEVPLGNYPGRGFTLPVKLRYSTRGLWRVGFINSVYVNVWGVNIPRSVAEAIYAEHSTAGWKTSLDVPKIEWPKLNDRYWADGKPYARGHVAPYTHRVANVFIHMPDGSTHELRKADQVYTDNNLIDMVGTFYAVDGSRLRYDSTGETTGTLYLPDGTRWILSGSTVQCIDRNGNTLTYNTATRQWTDTLGRTFSMPWPTNPGPGDYSYSLPAVNGSTVNYTIKFRNLSDALIAGSPALIPMSDYYLPIPGSPPTNQGGANFPQPTGTSTLFASGYSDPSEENQSTYTYVVGRGQSGAGVFNPVVLSQIVLPNGQSYQFSYNQYGELAKVIYPPGGYQRYSHGQVATIGGASVPYNQGSRGMTSRWISPTGSGTDEAQWSYTTTGSSITVTEPDATGAPNGTKYQTLLFNFAGSQTNFGYKDARNGLPYEERTYAPAAQGGAMLRRTLIEYGQTTGIYTKPLSQYPGTYTAYRNPRPNRSVSLILDTGGSALASTNTITYDGTYQFTVGLDAISSSDYSFVVVDQGTAQTGAITSIPNGTLLRTTQKSYLTSNANYRNRNILTLASSITILNAASQTVAQTTISYDEPSYPLIAIGPVTSWNDPLTNYRGNVTSTSRWLNYPTSTWISTHTQYDQCGSARYTWDGRGNQHSISYSSTYAFAFPTETTSAVPDPTGSHASSVSLVTTSVYDFNTGLVTSTTDANNQITTFEYNDSMNRPTKVNRPDGGWTMTDYSDAPGNNYVHTQMLQRTTPTQQTVETYRFFDKLGRASRAFTKEGTTYLTTDTQYDNLGRVWRVSNPYRTNALTDPVNPSGNWTTNGYDALSRGITVITPDGAQVGTAYSAVTTGTHIGPSVTVTDQAGKTRTTINDAQARTIRVIEDPNGLAYQTNYTYDVLNNLRKVEQGSQFRYFGYDSLSRLIRVRQVEQAVNNALSWADPVTGYNGWTMGFTYDANGNATSRVDARNITRTTTYDALNRPMVVLYRINNQPDPNTGDVEYLYDYASENGKGRPWITIKWGSSAFHTAIAKYDAVGRVKQLYRLWGNGQGGWHPAYEINATYDLAGHMTSQTYPSGHTVTYGYDLAGRLNSFAGNLGDGTQRTYSTGLSYSPFGMEQEQFGTQTPLYRKLHYNVRGQLYDVRVSTLSLAQDEFNWNRGALVFYFGGYAWQQSGPANNGSVTAQQHWVPTDDAISNYSYTQDSYTYDSLNRLGSTSEVHGWPGGQSGADYVQDYNYDRFGNRTVDQTLTTANVPRPAYTVDPNTNRLVAPAGFTYGYDDAGNQNFDSYTGEGARTFDAENRIKQAWAYNQWQTYTYDGDGERIKRLVNGIETWQVYGISGELLAEYAPVGAPTAPKKEYGYRNGELLINASGASCGVGHTSPKTWLGTSGSLYHHTGTAEGNNWAAYVGTHSSNTLVYGPYDTSFGRGHHTAQFTLMVDNNSGSDVVGTIDVVTNLGNTVLAQRQIRRSDFAATNQWQTFTLQFDNPCFGQTETRMWWNGNTNTKFAQVTITPLSVASPSLQWLVTDRLGTPRMVLDQTGSLAGISRHDYLPFGEEVSAGIGGRTTAQGYTGDSTRQHFTGYERDDETGLNFAQARYQSPVQGRFTSPDPLGGSAGVVNPQSFNRYSYVTNNPVNLTDPTGMMGMIPDASTSWSDVADGFWGTDFGGPRPSPGRQIIDNGMNGFPDRAEEEVEEISATSPGGIGGAGGCLFSDQKSQTTDSAGQKNEDASSNNGNAADIATDDELAKLFTNGGIVKAASSHRNQKGKDTHYMLANGVVHTLHIYANEAADKTTGLYAPKGWTVKWDGKSTVIMTHTGTGMVLNFYHVSNTPGGPAKNAAGSTYVGQIGGAGASRPGDKHSHGTLYKNEQSRNSVETWRMEPTRIIKANTPGFPRDIDSSRIDHIRDVRVLLFRR